MNNQLNPVFKGIINSTLNPSKNIDIKDVENLEIEGVDFKDYPDFCDAFFSSGEIDGRELTEIELDQLAENYPETLNEMAHESGIQ